MNLRRVIVIGVLRRKAADAEDIALQRSVQPAELNQTVFPLTPYHPGYSRRIDAD